MNAAIDLHDSELAAVTRDGASVVLSFSPAYLHRSEGRPGIDPGTGWTQAATFTFGDATVFSLTDLPVEVSDGWLRLGDVRHDNLLPADGEFEVPCELHLVLCRDTVPLVVRGTRLSVALQGARTYVEDTRCRSDGLAASVREVLLRSGCREREHSFPDKCVPKGDLGTRE